MRLGQLPEPVLSRILGHCGRAELVLLAASRRRLRSCVREHLEDAQPAGLAGLFRKYEKIPQSAGPAGGSWVVTEKVHGANFCLIATRWEVGFGCRTRLLDPTDDFYSFRSAGLADRLERAGRGLLEKLPGEQAVTVYGELFGGGYPHPEVPVEPGLSPVQRGVWYAPRIEFIGFDLCIGPPDSRRYLQFDQARDLCAAAGLLFVEPLCRGSLAACLEHGCEFDSTVPARLGLPLLDGPNLAEGVVVRSVSSRAMFKRKIEQFSETRYQSANWREVRAGGRTQWQPDREQLAEYEVLARVTPQRVDAVMSKMGRVEPQDKPRCRMLLQAMIEDVMDDLDASDQLVVRNSATLEQALRREAMKVVAKRVRH